jgi:penicillin amidase
MPRVRRAIFLLILAGAAALCAPAGARILRAESVLPPGESGFVSLAGLVAGTGSPYLYDQQDDFIHFRRKDDMLNRPGTTEEPRAGVRIVRDAKGVPAVHAGNDADVWWGAGYATAQDRLFELELFRRATQGHLAEILGHSYLPMDVQIRRDFYTAPELDRMLAREPAALRARYAAYLAGINAWIAHVRTSPGDVPGEFAAVADLPIRDFTARDLVAIGVYLARTTPNDDGSELVNARAVLASGVRRFTTILPLRVRGQVATVPRANGLFPSVPGRTRRQERAALPRSVAWLRGVTLPAATSDGTLADRALWRPLRRGGSSMVAIGDRAHRHALLFSGPELGFHAPEELYELEVDRPGLHARGVTAPGAPVVAIGHNEHVAWGLTSGLSQTNHLYAERLVPGHPDEYRYRGRVRRMSCRPETFTWNTPPTDLAGGKPPDNGSETLTLCRTVHGPVQARAGGWAFARRYATWGREADTLAGLAAVDEARTVTDVDRATAKLTWNENIMAADDRGHIGYWHPGLLPIAPKGWDERLPYPGDGRAEWRGFLPVARRPHVIDPKRGWLTNWNTVPSQGWTTGNDPASERLGGPFFRSALLDRLASALRRHPTFAGLRALVHTAGSTAQQRPLAAARLRAARRGAHGGGATVLDAILRWGGSYDRTAADGTTDPGASAWQAFKRAAQKLAIAPLGTAGRLIGGGEPNDEHLFDVSLGQAYALRTLAAGGYRRAAAAAYRTLVGEFGSGQPASWRAKRALFPQDAQGAEQPPPMPYFDRGTWEQVVELGGG